MTTKVTIPYTNILYIKEQYNGNIYYLTNGDTINVDWWDIKNVVIVRDIFEHLTKDNLQSKQKQI